MERGALAHQSAHAPWLMRVAAMLLPRPVMSGDIESIRRHLAVQQAFFRGEQRCLRRSEQRPRQPSISPYM